MINGLSWNSYFISFLILKKNIIIDNSIDNADLYHEHKGKFVKFFNQFVHKIIFNPFKSLQHQGKTRRYTSFTDHLSKPYMNTFESLGLSMPLQNAVRDLGYLEPTPVQQEVIPMLLQGEMDLVALAQTGTG